MGVKMENLEFNEILIGNLNKQALVIKGSKSFYYKVIKRFPSSKYKVFLLAINCKTEQKG